LLLRTIRVHPLDNVAIVVDPEGVAKGSTEAGAQLFRERIPQSQKAAVMRIESGERIVRYGQTIGRAKQAIEAGE
jgi:galactarate dehydratase